MENTLKKTMFVAFLILVAILSMFVIAPKVAQSDFTSSIIRSIDEKAETVLKLSASSTLASVGVSAIPGDTATPIADKLADLTKYFLLILCVLYTEKYLLTLIGVGFFKYLIPALCLISIILVFWSPAALTRARRKLLAFGLVALLAIPTGILISDSIYGQFESSIGATLATAEELNAKTEGLSQAENDATYIEKWLSKISETASGLTDKAANALNRFIESIAVLIVTTCIIPVLILLLFIWLTKLIFGVEIPSRQNGTQHSTAE